MVLDYAILDVAPGTAARVAAALPDSPLVSKRGNILGCWIAEIGQLNQITFVRAFDDKAAINEDRKLVGPRPDLPGCDGDLIALRQESFKPAAELPCAAPGQYGPFYEIRRYDLKEGGLAPTLAAWREAIPKRIELSPLVIIMHPLETETCIIHIWPFASLDQRQKVRAEAVKIGVWPPKESGKWISAAKSSISIPAPFSPLS